MKKNSAWIKCLMALTSLTSMFAVMLASPLCMSQYHQPVVPESLRNHD